MMPCTAFASERPCSKSAAHDKSVDPLARWPEVIAAAPTDDSKIRAFIQGARWPCIHRNFQENLFSSQTPDFIENLVDKPPSGASTLRRRMNGAGQHLALAGDEPA